MDKFAGRLQDRTNPDSLHEAHIVSERAIAMMRTGDGSLIESAAPMGEQTRAKRYYVSGYVQGVGYRMFAEREARKSGVHGYVLNLRDGRVEVYAIGTERQLRELRATLKRGPSGATVDEVAEDDAEIIEQYAGGFSIEHED